MFRYVKLHRSVVAVKGIAVSDETTPATNLTGQSAHSASSITVSNYNNSGTLTAWPASDVLDFMCLGY